MEKIENPEIGKKRDRKADSGFGFANVIDQVNEDLAKTENQFVKRLSGLNELRTNLQNELLAINQRVLNVHDMIRSFTDNEQTTQFELPNLTWDLAQIELKFSNNIDETLSKEIQHWDEQLRSIHKSRLAQIEELQKLICGQMEKYKQIKEYQSFVPKVLQEETPRQKTIKSLRRLQVFGKDWPDKQDFEWPTQEHLATIPFDDLKLSCVNWKNGAGIAAIQFEFKNGVVSPLILAKDIDDNKV